ncbi:hypothetical protein Glove_261g86 [Diversispora epigaea]|uniref:Hyaluronan/mRNA-binding protein domain-containing protein n=1 Tax=Diversispora epigaea TaxID=1348612 RepID=A0A397I696_9GLOM|nr:hypothetical protein Glove_261g86 [Diversispora epigaea]
MTRTKHPGSIRQDRHFQRSGILDLRGLPKKKGEGQHNWGKPTDEVLELPEDINVRTAEVYNNKLRVVDSKEFEILQNAVNLKEEEDRHFQRSGILDLRGLPKKKGEGQHNWGKPTDEVLELPEDINVRTAEVYNNKLRVVDSKEFEILQNAVNLKEEEVIES